MKWEEFIDENREEIDEFLGENNPMYTLIFLKGKLAGIIGRDKAMKLFERWLKLGITPSEQNKRIRTFLEKSKKRGVNVKFLSPALKVEYKKLMEVELS